VPREETQFKPGSCPNPGGRPKAETKVVEAARAAGEKSVEVLIDLLDDPDKRIRIEAAKALLDRGLGKPRQEQHVSGAVEHRLSLQEQHLDAVRALSRAVDGQPPVEDGYVPPVIDVTPESKDAA
jgi:hypothetical protein